MISCPWCKQIVKKDDMWIGNTYTCSCEKADVNELGYSFLVEFTDDNEILKYMVWLILQTNVYLVYNANHQGDIWSVSIDNLIEDKYDSISEGKGKHNVEEAASLLMRYRNLMVFT